MNLFQTVKLKSRKPTSRRDASRQTGLSAVLGEAFTVEGAAARTLAGGPSPVMCDYGMDYA